MWLGEKWNVPLENAKKQLCESVLMPFGWCLTLPTVRWGSVLMRSILAERLGQLSTAEKLARGRSHQISPKCHYCNKMKHDNVRSKNLCVCMEKIHCACERASSPTSSWRTLNGGKSGVPIWSPIKVTSIENWKVLGNICNLLSFPPLICAVFHNFCARQQPCHLQFQWFAWRSHWCMYDHI